MKNEYLNIEINPKGAELTSIKDVRSGFEYLWQADKNVWARHAPILFPIVGKVKNNVLLHNGRSYPMSQHGFARDQVFEKISESNNEVWYELKANAHTRTLYPFDFTIRLGYTLVDNTLSCSYEVVNKHNQPMYFSIGAHPGFNLPTAVLSDYSIVFDQPETEERHLLSEGLFNGTTKPVLSTPTQIDLNTPLFDDDAIVLKKLNSRKLTLQQKDGSFGIQLHFDGFPYLGIWTQKGNERYVCLEPWCGHADPVEGHDDISTKQGIIRLEGNKLFKRSYRLTFNS